ncbi:hypothetical protein F4811DRAFT_421305 [Daldinia bambusicola]|nr:hypothetical protein F4811DRAFT_421305 [Daldinia bambusicola]
MESQVGDSTASVVHEDDVAMDEAQGQSPQDSDYNVQDEWDLGIAYTNGTSTSSSGNIQGQETNISTDMSRLHPIMVVLHPPPDPTIYERIYPSQTVERILDEMEDEDGDIYYSVEFEDGYIEDCQLFLSIVIRFHPLSTFFIPRHPFPSITNSLHPYCWRTPPMERV